MSIVGFLALMPLHSAAQEQITRATSQDQRTIIVEEQLIRAHLGRLDQLLSTYALRAKTLTPDDRPTAEAIGRKADRLFTHLRFLETQTTRLGAPRAEILSRTIRILRLRARNVALLSSQTHFGKAEAIHESTGAENGGFISGTVTSTITGLPLEEVSVSIFDQHGFYVAQVLTGSDGRYQFSDLNSGTYFARTYNSEGLLDELYGGLPCPNASFSQCNPKTDTPISVNAGVFTSEIDFNLGPGSRISGRVRDSSTGLAIPDIGVDIWNSEGIRVNGVSTDAAGRFTSDALTPGTYFATTLSFEHFDELYDDLPCLGGGNYCNPTTGTPVSTTDGLTVFGLDFELERLGRISGKITDSVSGEPIPFVEVQIWNSSGERARSTFTESDGRYVAGGLVSGTYFVTTDIFAYYQNELYDDVPCLEISTQQCDPTAGTPVVVTLNQITPGVDFALERLGVITGTVTDTSTKDPIPFEDVLIWDSSGARQGRGITNPSGGYRIEDLPEGTYFATSRTDDYQDELYDDLLCSDSAVVNCDPTTGTPIFVALNTITPGIDFALERLGSIAGALTDAATGSPIESQAVLVWNSNGVRRDIEYTDSSGSYRFEELEAGTFFVTTSTQTHLNEVFDDLPCTDSGNNSCDPTTGMPVVVELNNDSQGIDFELEQLGTISGTLRDLHTSEPIAFEGVFIWNSAGIRIGFAATNHLGEYKATGLRAGTYFITTDTDDHLDQLYDEIVCPESGIGNCDVTTGTPLIVSLNTTISGIDFELPRLGAIEGTLTEASTGDSISFSRVHLWNSHGEAIFSRPTDSAGTYQFARLQPGTYFVSTGNSNTHVSELYDDLPCPYEGSFPSCNPASGTPVVVSLNATTSGVDFVLERLGKISGRLTNATTGKPIYAGVKVWDAVGVHVRSADTNSTGEYVTEGLEAGAYYVTAGSASYLNELYDDVSCPDDDCDLTTGIPVVVTLNATTTNIDFALEPANGISGRVISEEDAAPLIGVAIDFWDPSGAYVASTSSGLNGEFRYEALPGSYFVSTDSGRGYQNEIFENVPCPDGPAFGGKCDPTTGKLITISNGPFVNGVDFQLKTNQIFADGFELDDVPSGSHRRF